jgi:hypothetical protein
MKASKRSFVSTCFTSFTIFLYYEELFHCEYLLSKLLPVVLFLQEWDLKCDKAILASLILFMLLTDIGVVDGGLILDGCYTTAVCFEEENKSILSARTVRGTDIETRLPFHHDHFIWPFLLSKQDHAAPFTLRRLRRDSAAACRRATVAKRFNTSICEFVFSEYLINWFTRPVPAISLPFL